MAGRPLARTIRTYAFAALSHVRRRCACSYCLDDLRLRIGITKQRSDHARRLGNVAEIEHCPLRRKVLGYGATRRVEARRPSRRGLEGDKPESLVQRRKEDDTRVSVQPASLGLGDRPEVDEPRLNVSMAAEECSFGIDGRARRRSAAGEDDEVGPAVHSSQIFCDRKGETPVLMRV